MAVDPPSAVKPVTLTLEDVVPVTVTARAMRKEPEHTIFTKSFEGYQMRFDYWGRIVIDKCASDHEHLVNPKITNEERSLCRHLLEQLIPPEYLGKEGDITIAIQFTPKKQSLSMGTMVEPEEHTCGICEEKKP